MRTFLASLLSLLASTALAQATPSVDWRIRLDEQPALIFDHLRRQGDIGPWTGVDGGGNLFLAATTITISTSCMVVMKRAAADGQLAWRRDQCGPDFGTAAGGLVVDAAGDVLVTGSLFGDLYVAKLAGGTGTPLWERRIPSSVANGINTGIAIGLDASGNARVAALDTGITVYSFRNAEGLTLWQRDIDRGTGNAKLHGFAMNAAGNVVVSDRHEIDLRENVADVLTYIDSSGTIAWQQTTEGSTIGLRMDAAGNVAGNRITSLEKRSAATGAVLWSTAPTALLRFDAQGGLFATGEVFPPGQRSDARTARLSPADGSVLWESVAVDPETSGNGNDIAFDAAGHVLVLGREVGADARWRQVLAAHDADDGRVPWTLRESDPLRDLFPHFIHAVPGGFVAIGSWNDGAGSGLYVNRYALAEPPAPTSVSNLSTRLQVLTGDDVPIGGFIIGGTAAKTVVIRARGPSLAAAGVGNALGNPTLQLVRSSDGATIAANDDWGMADNAAAIQASGFAPGHPLESAILASLAPGAYTAIVTGAGGATGVGIVEVFEVDAPEAPLVNLSTRGPVRTGHDVMIGGFIIQGSAQAVVIRARGPSLAGSGVANALANPILQLVRSSDGATVASNDNWGEAANAAQVSASGFAPADGFESAILVTLEPGAYTAIVTGAGGGTGVGIVEVFLVR